MYQEVAVPPFAVVDEDLVALAEVEQSATLDATLGHVVQIGHLAFGVVGHVPQRDQGRTDDGRRGVGVAAAAEVGHRVLARHHGGNGPAGERELGVELIIMAFLLHTITNKKLIQLNSICSIVPPGQIESDLNKNER